MTVENAFQMTTLLAGADLSAQASLHKAIDVNGTIAANNSTAIGLVKSLQTSGYPISVAWFGEMKAVASAAITKGAKVSVTTSGFIVTAPVSTAPLGKALETVNSGDYVRILADFAQGLWT